MDETWTASTHFISQKCINWLLLFSADLMKESQSETTAAVSLSENIVASPFLKAREEVEAGLIFSPGNNIFTVTSSDHTSKFLSYLSCYVSIFFL